MCMNEGHRSLDLEREKAAPAVEKELGYLASSRKSSRICKLHMLFCVKEGCKT